MTPNINQVITTKNWRDIAENALRDKSLSPITRSYLHTLLGAPSTLAAQESDLVAKLFRARSEAEIITRLEAEISEKIIDLTKEDFPKGAA